MALAKRGEQDDSANIGGKRVRTVRGGGICQKADKPALNRDTMQTMLCVATPGADPRPRWSSPGAGSSKGSQGSRGSHGSHAHASTDPARVNRRQR